MPVSIRAMEAKDFASCRDLWQSDPHIHSALVDDAETFRRYLEHNPQCSQVAVEESGTVIGALAAGHDGFRGSCHHLYVVPKHRGKGVARALAEAAMTALKAAGIKRCFVWVYASNVEGDAFWRKIGFESWSDCPTYSMHW